MGKIIEGHQVTKFANGAVTDIRGVLDTETHEITCFGEADAKVPPDVEIIDETFFEDGTGKRHEICGNCHRFELTDDAEGQKSCPDCGFLETASALFAQNRINTKE